MVITNLNYIEPNIQLKLNYTTDKRGSGKLTRDFQPGNLVKLQPLLHILYIHSLMKT